MLPQQNIVVVKIRSRALARCQFFYTTMAPAALGELRLFFSNQDPVVQKVESAYSPDNHYPVAG